MRHQKERSENVELTVAGSSVLVAIPKYPVRKLTTCFFPMDGLLTLPVIDVF